MREPSEMHTASRMQNMVQLRKENTYFVTSLPFIFLGKSYLGALGVESPHGGAMFSYYLFEIDGPPLPYVFDFHQYT